MEIKRPEYVQDIKRILMVHFDIEELEALAFDLAIDWDNLRGTNKELKTQALIKYHTNRGELKGLIAAIREKRPNAKLPDIPKPIQQMEDADYSVHSFGSDLEIQMNIKANTNDVSGSYIFVKALVHLIERADTGLWQKLSEEMPPDEFYATLLTAIADHYSADSPVEIERPVHEWLEMLVSQLRFNKYLD